MKKGLLIGCWLCAGLWTYAAVVTAIPVSRTEAQLDGDVTSSMSVTYQNTTKGGEIGQVTKDHSATLTISGLPAGTVKSIVLHVRSNTDAGGGMVMMKMGNRSWLVANGNFDKWQDIGTYSTTYIPMTCLQQPQQIKRGTSLVLQIAGAVNSVYWSQLDIEYEEDPPVPYTVTLQWLSHNGVQTQTISEPAVQAGVYLPSVPEEDSEITYLGKTWYWLGWSEQAVDVQSVSPLCWQTDDWYGPEEDGRLYALYTDAPELGLRQDSSMADGEYAVVLVSGGIAFAMSGTWEEGKIALQEIYLEQDAKGYVWKMTNLDDSYRYQFTFRDDSVAIYHPQSKSWIGHAEKTGSKRHNQWAWKKAKEGTLFLYGRVVEPKSWHLDLYIDWYLERFYASYLNSPYQSDFPYWRLFPTEKVPSKTNALYTTFLGVTANSVVKEQPVHNTTKYLDGHGRIIIRYNNSNYNLLGQPL